MEEIVSESEASAESADLSQAPVIAPFPIPWQLKNRATGLPFLAFHIVSLGGDNWALFGQDNNGNLCIASPGDFVGQRLVLEDPNKPKIQPVTLARQ